MTTPRTTGRTFARRAAVLVVLAAAGTCVGQARLGATRVGDGTVNTLDFLAFLNAWTEGC